MGKASRRRQRKPNRNDSPRHGQPDESFSFGTHEKLSVEISPNIPPQTQSMEIPVAFLGEPANELERQSPAFQAARILSERGFLPGPGGEQPPGQYESVEAGWAVDPPPMIAPVGGKMRMDVAPFRSPNLARPSVIIREDLPPEVQAQIEATVDIDPDSVAVRTSWTAGQALEQHTELTERLTRPTGQVLDYFRYFVTDAYRKNPQRAQGMFYPADLRPLADAEVPDPGTSVAQQISAFVARGLRDALTFQVTEEMVAVMRQVHDKTQENVTYLDEAELPSPAGFAWLDKPWPLRDRWSNYIPIRALTWELEHAWASVEGERKYPGDIPRRVPCVRVGLWTWMDDDIAYGRWIGNEHRAKDISDSIGELTFMHLALLPFGAEFQMANPPADERKKMDSPESILGILHTLWMFLGMEIVSTEPATDVPRLARKRALRSLRHGEVRVVTLRKIRHVHSGDIVNPRDIDWSCRWVVQGHWRHIDKYEGEKHHAIREVRRGEKHDACGICSSRGEEARVTWIGPYLKGPDGAPLKSADKLVYRLSR